MSNRSKTAWGYSKSFSKKSALADRIIGATAFPGGDQCCGKRGARRDVKGAKKFVNSRFRFHEKMALVKLLKVDDAT